MSKWDVAKKLVEDKLCGAARRSQPCNHRGCVEAQLALDDLNDEVFSDLARTVLTNRFCQKARQGDDCGHPTCAKIRWTLDEF